MSGATARADNQPDARPIQFTNCALGGAAGGASQVATGGTAVTLNVHQPLRGVYVQNPSTATESLFVEIAQTASGTVNPASTTAGVSIELQPGQSFTEGPGTINAGGLSFNAATSSHAFVCKIGT